ncbi:MAG TPA: polyphosphate polymerase domain-containing protein [Chitinophagales bacterium]|nr:polyphosphate polymerase domain-containing protein [Chitinophagales bacterium]
MSFDYPLRERRIREVLSTFDAISLKGLDDVKMLNRIDTKYVFHIDEFAGILDEIRENYYALEIEGNRMFAYESLYFDTDDYQLYKFHHNGKINRLKVRYRRYSDSGLVFFEVKYKVKGNRTDKKRLKQEELKMVLTDEELELVSHHQLDHTQLSKKMWIFFNRITLASKKMNERLTLDLHVAFDNFSNKKAFPELIIAEVKTDKSATGSPIIKCFNKRNFEEVGFSKYSTAVAMMEDIKGNAFKPNFIKIEKIIKNGNSRNGN